MSFWDNLWERLQTFGENVIEWLILLVVALIVIVIGRWVIRLIRTFFEKLLGAAFLAPLWERSGVSKALAETDQTPASLVATVIYAYLMVALFSLAASILNMTTIETLLERLLAWIPVLILAAVIVIIAAAAGHWTASLVRPFANEQGIPWLTVVVHVAVIIFGLLFAMDIMNIDFAQDIVMIVLASGTVALAIAFGVGGIDAAKKWWAKYGSPSSSGGGGGSGGTSSSGGGTPPSNM
ncbi:MAG: hypothetical protein WBM90_12620 [Acidimicrobiia bacterium]